MIRLSLVGLVCLDISKIKKTSLQMYFVYIVNSGDLYSIGEGSMVFDMRKIVIRGFSLSFIVKYILKLECWVVHSVYISPNWEITRDTALVDLIDQLTVLIFNEWLNKNFELQSELNFCFIQFNILFGKSTW